ncbi:hypothetical protein KCU83_g3813, partial [Aureobasidium melanogenum]
MDAENLVQSQPLTLVDLLNNTLIWRQTAPYLSAGSVLALSATARTFRHTICESPETFRHLNLTLVKSATLVDSSPIDKGGISWRAERMDESLTEDDFFSGPLRGVFSKLERQHLLQNVKTLILDGLSVPAELVREIILEDRFNVKILSIRDVTNMNQRGLQSVLRYIVRPSASRLPKLKGLYLFGRKDAPATLSQRAQSKTSGRMSTGVMSSEGAQIGAEWNSRSEIALSASLGHDQPLDDWWKTKGDVWNTPGSTKYTPSPDWADILLACQGQHQNAYYGLRSRTSLSAQEVVSRAVPVLNSQRFLIETLTSTFHSWLLLHCMPARAYTRTALSADAHAKNAKQNASDGARIVETNTASSTMNRPQPQRVTGASTVVDALASSTRDRLLPDLTFAWLTTVLPPLITNDYFYYCGLVTIKAYEQTKIVPVSGLNVV